MKELPEELQARIIAYIDGDLPADEAAALEVYLANTDPGLSEMVVGMMADRHSLSVLPKIKAPHDLSGRVMEQLERSSLLHNVEQDLTHAERPWWHSRAAMAASVALVIGGFSYFVIHTVYRGGGLLKDAAKTTAVIRGGGAGGGAAPESEGVADTGESLDKAAKFKSPGEGFEREGLAAALPSHDALNAASRRELLKTKAGAPMSLVMDTRESTEDKLQRDKEMLHKGLAVAKANGYIEASSAQVALNKVHAAPEATVDGPPVVLYFVARDGKDVSRLESRLASFMENTQDAEVNLVRTNQVSVDLAKAEAGAAVVDNVSGGAASKVSVSAKSGGTPTLSGNNSINGNDSNRAGGNGSSTLTSTTQAAVAIGGNTTLRRGNDGAATPGTTANSDKQFDNNTVTLDNGQLTFNRNTTNDNYRVLRPNSYLQRNTRAEQQQRAAETIAESDTFAGQVGQPFRVYLRPEQLDQLTTEFRVLTINRGRVSYVIPREKAQEAPRTQAAVPGDEKDVQKKPRAGKAGPSDATAETAYLPGPAVAPPAPARPDMPSPTQVANQPAEEAKAAKDETRADHGANVLADERPKDARLPSAPIGAIQAGARIAQQKRQDGQWIEVIIAMDPPVAAVAAPAATMPGKPATETMMNLKSK